MRSNGIQLHRIMKAGWKHREALRARKAKRQARREARRVEREARRVERRAQGEAQKAVKDREQSENTTIGATPPSASSPSTNGKNKDAGGVVVTELLATDKNVCATN